MNDETCKGVSPDSVVASMDAPYLRSSSTTAIRFFLHAMCSGVKPFWKRIKYWSLKCHFGFLYEKRSGKTCNFDNLEMFNSIAQEWNKADWCVRNLKPLSIVFDCNVNVITWIYKYTANNVRVVSDKPADKTF